MLRIGPIGPIRLIGLSHATNRRAWKTSAQRSPLTGFHPRSDLSTRCTPPATRPRTRLPNKLQLVPMVPSPVAPQSGGVRVQSPLRHPDAFAPKSLGTSSARLSATVMESRCPASRRPIRFLFASHARNLFGALTALNTPARPWRQRWKPRLCHRTQMPGACLSKVDDDQGSGRSLPLNPAHGAAHQPYCIPRATYRPVDRSVP